MADDVTQRNLRTVPTNLTKDTAAAAFETAYRRWDASAMAAIIESKAYQDSVTSAATAEAEAIVRSAEDAAQRQGGGLPSRDRLLANVLLQFLRERLWRGALQRVANARRKSLEERVAELERTVAEKAISYEGVFDDQRTYTRGAFVTHAGSLWHANATCRGRRPGEGSSWTLAVKRGRDGRGA